MYISLFFYGLGGGMLSPGVSSSLSISVGKENQGSASGFLGMVIPVGHVISPIISMPLYSVSPSYPYLLGSVLMLISFIFILSNNRHKWIKGIKTIKMNLNPFRSSFLLTLSNKKRIKSQLFDIVSKLKK